MEHDNVALKGGLLNSLLECIWCYCTIVVQTTTTAVTVFSVELNPDLFISLSDKLILITIPFSIGGKEDAVGKCSSEP